MAYSGGAIVDLVCNHETAGTLVLKTKAAEDNSLDLGGIRGADDKSMISGDGTETIRSLNPGRWEAKMTILWDMITRQEVQKLIEIAGSPIEGTWTITHINGSIYQGVGSPVGEIAANTNNVTAPLTLQGANGLKKIA